MRIFLISFLGRGGMLHYTSQLANSLCDENEVHTLLPCHSDTGYFHSQVMIHGIKAPASVFYTFILSFNIIALYRMIKNINSVSPEVIHILNTHPWNVFICKFCNGPKMRVFTLHDPVPHERSLAGRPAQFLLSCIERLTIRWSDRIIVHGIRQKDSCIAMGIPREKVDVIPHGDYSFFTRYAKKNYIRSEKKIVLFFGRIEPYKGIEYFIEAANEVSANIPDSLFIIAGDGNFKPYNGLIQNKTIFRVINRYIEDQEVAELFSIADAVVLPYISGTQTGVIPIAYAFKKPVVATDVGSIPEVVEDGTTGLIVPPRDAKNLSRAIIRLLSDRKLAETMGENAYRKMNKELSWGLVSKKLASIYFRQGELA